MPDKKGGACAPPFLFCVSTWKGYNLKMRYLKYAFAFLFVVFFGCALIKSAKEVVAVKSLNVTVDRVEIVKVNFDGIDTRFYLQAKNPNSVDARIISFDFDALFNGNKVAKGKLSETVVVPSHSTKTITVPVFVPFSAISVSLKSSIIQKNVEAGITGYVTINTPLGKLRFKVMDKTRRIL